MDVFQKDDKNWLFQKPKICNLCLLTLGPRKLDSAYPFIHKKLRITPEKRYSGYLWSSLYLFTVFWKWAKNMGWKTDINPSLLDIAYDTLYSTPIVKRADFLGSRGEKWVQKYHKIKWYNLLVLSPCLTTKLCFLK